MIVDNKNLKEVDLRPKIHRVKLKGSLAVPSEINNFSMATGYMKLWFLEKFPKDFFKAINVDDSHAFNGFRHSSITQNLKKMKPSLQIIPRINFEYNREMIDLNIGGAKQYLNRDSINRAFFQDKEKNIYLSLALEESEIQFQFRVRVKTRTQEIDIAKAMKLNFSIGTTQGRYVDLDFHIPYSTMLSIAKDTGFIIEDNKIKNLVGFIQYMNSHSAYPILYKYQTVSGINDFFVRIENIYAHINCKDDLSVDDGEQEGQLKSNYIIEMNCVLHIGSPKVYAYFSQNDYTNIIETENSDSTIPIYDILLPELPDKNDKGWSKFLNTEIYEDDLSKPLSCEFKELFDGSDIQKLIELNNKSYISSSTFIDIKLYNDSKEVPFTINWSKEILETKDILKSNSTHMIIYVDLEYMNQQIINMNKLYSDVLRTSKN